MRHKEQIKLSKKCIAAVSQKDEKTVIGELFGSEKILTLLRAYDHFADVNGEIDDFTIIRVNFGKSNTSFSIDVEYIVTYYFGCDDLNQTRDEEMEIQIDIDPRTDEAVLTGENEEKREPDVF